YVGVLSHCCPCSLFFFSSRRRHTRFSRDWSSDVCSSDLARHILTAVPDVELHGTVLGRPSAALNTSVIQHSVDLRGREAVVALRSEERRVGKEGRARGLAAEDTQKRSTQGEGAAEGVRAN